MAEDRKQWGGFKDKVKAMRLDVDTDPRRKIQLATLDKKLVQVSSQVLEVIRLQTCVAESDQGAAC